MNKEFNLNKSQDSKLRAMQIMNNYSFTWEELRVLFQLVEIEKKLSKLIVSECNTGGSEALTLKIKKLEAVAEDYLNILNNERELKFSLEFGADVRGLQLKLFDSEGGNVLYNIYNY